MENKFKRIKCPSCLNYMTVTVNEKKETRGFCKKCRAAIIAKQPSVHEWFIRIIKEM